MVVITQNEVSIIKNAVLDSTEAYVDARLDNLNFVKTQIGTVTSDPIKNNKGKYEHTVKCNMTSGTSGVVYNKVLSVGNTPFPRQSVVFVIAPNAQFSNMFILGKLDDTPCNISAGSIRLGGTNESDAPIYLTGTQQSDGSYGHLASFKIFPSELKFTDGEAISYLTPHTIRLTEFVNGHKVSMMFDTTNERIALNSDGGNNCFVVSNYKGWDDLGNFPPSENGDYIKISPTSITSKTSRFGALSLGTDVFKFLWNCQSASGNPNFYTVDNLQIAISDSYIILNNLANGKYKALSYDN